MEKMTHKCQNDTQKPKMIEVRKSALSLLGSDIPDQEKRHCKSPIGSIYLSCSKTSKLQVEISREGEVKEAMSDNISRPLQLFCFYSAQNQQSLQGSEQQGDMT